MKLICFIMKLKSYTIDWGPPNQLSSIEILKIMTALGIEF